MYIVKNAYPSTHNLTALIRPLHRHPVPTPPVPQIPAEAPRTSARGLDFKCFVCVSVAIDGSVVLCESCQRCQASGETSTAPSRDRHGLHQTVSPPTQSKSSCPHLHATMSRRDPASGSSAPCALSLDLSDFQVFWVIFQRVLAAIACCGSRTRGGRRQKRHAQAPAIDKHALCRPTRPDAHSHNSYLLFRVVSTNIPTQPVHAECRSRF